MSIFKAIKTDGWNKYKIQKRFMLLFWRDVDGELYVGRGLENLRAVELNVKFRGNV